MSYETVRRLLRLQRNDDVGLLVKYDRKEKIDPSDVAVDVEIRDEWVKHSCERRCQHNHTSKARKEYTTFIY